MLLSLYLLPPPLPPPLPPQLPPPLPPPYHPTILYIKYIYIYICVILLFLSGGVLSSHPDT